MKHRLTEGGLYLTLRAGEPQDILRCRWSGAWMNRDWSTYLHPGGELIGVGHWLAEIEVIAARGKRVLVRVKAPEFVRIARAGMDGRVEGGGGRAA